MLAMVKKEIMDLLRSGRFVLLGIIFVMLGIMNPAIAKLTPWLMKMMAEAMETSGIVVTDVTVDAFVSWQQFIKNIPMGIIALVLIESNIFTKEYESGTLILSLTKGLERYKVVLSKMLVLFILWTVCYIGCFGITYVYNGYFWDNSIINNLGVMGFNWWLFGILIIAILGMISTIVNNNTMVLLGTGGLFAILFLVGMVATLKKYLPIKLMDSWELINGMEDAAVFSCSIIITLILIVLMLILSVLFMNKKNL